MGGAQAFALVSAVLGAPLRDLKISRMVRL